MYTSLGSAYEGVPRGRWGMDAGHGLKAEGLTGAGQAEGGRASTYSILISHQNIALQRLYKPAVNAGTICPQPTIFFPFPMLQKFSCRFLSKKIEF
jgi:hypothetical protein